MIRYLIIIASLLISIPLFAQETRKIEVRHADEMTGYQKKRNYQKLIGNVVFFHDNALMYCDSAYNYRDVNAFEAFGHVRIEQEGKLHITGSQLKYNGNLKLIVISGNVAMSDGSLSIYSNELFYDRGNEKAYYNNMGKIVDSANTLTSKAAVYYSKTKDVYFKKDVVLENTDFTLNCDTLAYNSSNHVARFLSPTHIVGEDLKIYTENGWYDTEIRKSEFRKNAYIFNKEHQIYGDTLYFENESNYARAQGNIRFIDTSNNSEIQGQFAEYFGDLNSTYVTKKPVYINYMENDTLYMKADTFRMKKDSSENDLLLAYKNVLAFSDGMQFKCDSFSYYSSDSMMRFYGLPVIWNEKNQLTGIEISVETKNDEPHKLYINGDCLIIENVDGLHYNQVKGRTAIGHFKKGNLNYLDVIGNSESIYFLTDDEQKFIGMNKNQSSKIRIQFKESNINTISFLSSPVGKVIPPEKMDGPEARFDKFIWRGNERPLSKAAIISQRYRLED